MKDVISIIVPVYNVELYLEECLSSIINQTYSNLEIIVVNDGSTDGSSKILEEFADNDKRICVIEEHHVGASMARNKGIYLAKGEYIYFVDSDDFIEKNTIEIFYNTCVIKESDIVIGNVLNYFQDGRRVRFFHRSEKLNNITLTGKQCFVELMKNDSFFPMPFLYFVKKKFLLDNQLYFEEGIVYEDELWSLKAILSAKHISLIDSYHYLYRQREGSVMESTDKELRLISFYVVVKNIHLYISNYFEEKEILGYAYIKIFRLFHDMMSLQYDFYQTNTYITYFSNLLIVVYSKMPYYHQKICLNWYQSAMRKMT